MVLAPRNIRRGSILSIPVQFGKPVSSESVTAKLIETKRLPGGGEEVKILAEKTVNVANGKITGYKEINLGDYCLLVNASIL